MADALKAQVELLTGTGDFASTGSLESLLPLEESIRKKTAQTDTDILRQTLLGGGSEQKYTPDGRVIVDYEVDPSTDGRHKVIRIGNNTFTLGGEDAPNWGIGVIDTKTGNLVHEETGSVVPKMTPGSGSGILSGVLVPDMQDYENKVNSAIASSLRKTELFDTDQINT